MTWLLLTAGVAVAWGALSVLASERLVRVSAMQVEAQRRREDEARAAAKAIDTPIVR